MNTNGRIVTVNGVKYPSIQKACDALGWNVTTFGRAARKGNTTYRGVKFRISGTVVKDAIDFKMPDGPFVEKSYCPRVDHIVNNYGTMHVQPENGRRLMGVRVCR